MESRSFFRGTSADQDDRFANKEKKLLKTMKFPPVFNQKVDISKVHLPSFKKWINNKLKQLEIDDEEFMSDYIVELLLEKNPDPKVIQINITGFLEDNTSSFMTSLWTLLVEAQSKEGGIPEEFLEEIKKASLETKREEDRIKEALVKSKIKIEKSSSHNEQKPVAYGLQKPEIKDENNVKMKIRSKWDEMSPPVIESSQKKREDESKTLSPPPPMPGTPSSHTPPAIPLTPTTLSSSNEVSTSTSPQPQPRDKDYRMKSSERDHPYRDNRDRDYKSSHHRDRDRDYHRDRDYYHGRDSRDYRRSDRGYYDRYDKYDRHYDEYEHGRDYRRSDRDYRKDYYDRYDERDHYKDDKEYYSRKGERENREKLPSKDKE